MGPSNTKSKSAFVTYATLQVRLADHYRALGRADLAKRRYLKLAESSPPTLGDNSDRLRVYHGLALAEWDDAAYRSARDWQRKARVLAEQTRGAGSSTVATCLNNLAELARQAGDWEGAEQLIRQVLDVRMRLRGDWHPEVAISLNNLAECYRQTGVPDSASLIYQWALAIVEYHSGPQTSLQASVLGNQALLDVNREDYETGFERYRTAFQLLAELDYVAPAILATLLNNFGTLLHRLGDLESARVFYERAIDLLSGSSSWHPGVSLYLSNLALVNLDLGNHQMAVAVAARAEAMLGPDLGPPLPINRVAWENLLALYQRLGDEERQRNLRARIGRLIRQSKSS